MPWTDLTRPRPAPARHLTFSVKGRPARLSLPGDPQSPLLVRLQARDSGVWLLVEGGPQASEIGPLDDPADLENFLAATAPPHPAPDATPRPRFRATRPGGTLLALAVGLFCGLFLMGLTQQAGGLFGRPHSRSQAAPPPGAIPDNCGGRARPPGTTPGATVPPTPGPVRFDNALLPAAPGAPVTPSDPARLQALIGQAVGLALATGTTGSRDGRATPPNAIPLKSADRRDRPAAHIPLPGHPATAWQRDPTPGKGGPRQ